MNQSNGSNFTAINNSYTYKWQDYVILSLTGFGSIISLVNVLIFSSRSLQDVRYKYMLFKSASILAYMFLTFIGQIISNYAKTTIFGSFLSAVFTLVVSIYLSSSLAIFRILLEVTLAIHTYSILLKRNSWFNLHAHKLITVLFLVSLLFYLQKPFGVTILQNPTTNIFVWSFNSFGLSKVYDITSICQASVRIFLVVVVLFVVNCLNVIEIIRWSNGNGRVGVIMDANQIDVRRNSRKFLSMLSFLFLDYRLHIGSFKQIDNNLTVSSIDF